MSVFKITVGNGGPQGNVLSIYKDGTVISGCNAITGGYITISGGSFEFQEYYHLSSNTGLIAAMGSYPVSGQLNASTPDAATEIDITLADGRVLHGTHTNGGGYAYVWDSLQEAPEPEPLDPPVLSPSYGTGSVSFAFELPEGGSGFKLEVADNDDFTDATSATWTSSPVTIDNLEGTLYFRAKFLGTEGGAEDSDWSSVESHTFLPVLDPPVLAPTYEDDAAGFDFTLPEGANCFKLEYARNADFSDAEAEIEDVPPLIVSGLDGLYYFRAMFVAEDGEAEDSDWSEVESHEFVPVPRLPVPTMIAEATGESTALVKVTDVSPDAVKWRVRYAESGTTEYTIVDRAVDESTYIISGLDSETEYDIQVRAIGDGVEHSDSDWTDVQTIETLGPRTGKFYVWEASTIWSKDSVKRQNILFRAKVTNLDDGTIIPRSEIESIKLTVLKYEKQDRTEQPRIVDGYNGISIPVTAFLTAADPQGFNFRFFPDQRVLPMFPEDGRYDVQVDVKLNADNPLCIIYQNVICS